MPAHFEIHASNVEKAKAFYAAVLGWEFTPMEGAEDIEYHLVSAADIGEGQGMTGAIFKRMDAQPDAGGPIRGCTLTFEVSDCDATYKTALAHGGAEALPPTDFEGIGRCAYCEDGQGNVFGFITPLAN